MSISGAVGLIGAFNECVNFFQWTKSSISSLRSWWSDTEEKNIQDEVSRLQTGLQRLKDTRPAMYGLIDRAEWKSHKPCVAELLPILKDAVYDADDILDEFRWHELHVAGQGNATHSAFADFYKTTIQGSFNKVNDIQERLNGISSKLNQIPGLHEGTPWFDKSVRPDTISSPSKEMFGRDKDMEQVMGLLGVPQNNRGGRPKRKRASSTVNASTSTPASNQVSNESQAIPVLPIVGMGGIGKTTLAQHVCNHRQVKTYFDLIIWVCADDFDVKRLTNDAIQASSGKQTKLDHLDSLQRALSENLSNKRFLIVVDDVWDDALKENGQRWENFCVPFRNAVHGSMMLVTTRSPEVADGVCTNTIEPVQLHGLTDVVLWDFFKLCAFGSNTSENSPDLERIGRSILPKLKGSPVAAITLGRLLRMNLDISHWENILESELWELKQEETDILPALRLSYMYLPPHLKRCFSFCAVYPKDHKFKKDRLAEIWVAEGFVKPQGDTPLKDIGSQYFQDLVNRSFFQKVAGSYVIHDLLHDMAQLVSVHDCFIVKSVGDSKKVPQNVRHLYILPNTDFDSSHLVRLSKHTKLRTLLCHSYMKKDSVDSVVGSWFGELRRMRVLLCTTINKLPDSVGNLKHLRYLEITRICPSSSLPSEFYCLYNLQRLYAEKWNIESFPNDSINKLISLQSFKSSGFQYYPLCKLEIDAASGHGSGIRLIKNMNQVGELRIRNLAFINKDEALEAKLKNKKYLHTLRLYWSSSTTLSLPKHNGTDVFEVLQPPASLKHLSISWYPGVSLPSWFQPQNFPMLATLSFQNCGGLDSTALWVSQNINLNDTLERNNAIIGTFSSLREFTISGCGNIVSLNDVLDPASNAAFTSLISLTVSVCAKLSTLDDFLTAERLPAVEKITISRCPELLSLPSERYGSFHSLKTFEVSCCPSVNWQRGLVLPSSLQKLNVCGDISAVFPSCLQNLALLISLKICACPGITSIPGNVWRSYLPSLKELTIECCPNLESIGGEEAIAKIEYVKVTFCPKIGYIYKDQC